MGIRIKRGTRAQLDAAASSNGLIVGEPYLITDEDRMAVGTAVNAYETYAKESETGGGWTVVTKTGAYTALAGEHILADTTSGGFTITLPASPATGNQVAVVELWSC